MSCGRGYCGYCPSRLSSSRKSCRPCSYDHCTPIQRVWAAINVIFSGIGKFFNAIFFFSLIALFSFLLPTVMKVWNPQLTGLQMTVDRMEKDVALVEHGLKKSVCRICKLCHQSTMMTSCSNPQDKKSAPYTCCKDLAERSDCEDCDKHLPHIVSKKNSLDSVKDETTNPNVQPKRGESPDFVFDDIFIKSDDKAMKEETNSLEFGKTSREMYKVPTKNERRSNNAPVLANQGDPDVPTVLGRPRNKASVDSKENAQNSRRNSNTPRNSKSSPRNSKSSPRNSNSTNNAIKSQFRDRT